jgi:rhodanese-related sulfurtransferase
MDTTEAASTSDLTPSEVTPAQALNLHEIGEVTLLDVREPDEWAQGHAAGAVHIPLAQLDPAALDTSKPIVAVCRSGNRSGKATQMLRQAGINVRNMAGGMSTWHEQGLPVVAVAGTPGTV